MFAAISDLTVHEREVQRDHIDDSVVRFAALEICEQPVMDPFLLRVVQVELFSCHSFILQKSFHQAGILLHLSSLL